MRPTYAAVVCDGSSHLYWLPETIEPALHAALGAPLGLTVEQDTPSGCSPRPS